MELFLNIYRQLGEPDPAERPRADMIAVKLRRIGREVSQLFSDDPKNEFTEEEIELLARMEHNRWCAERFIDGWNYGPERGWEGHP